MLKRAHHIYRVATPPQLDVKLRKHLAKIGERPTTSTTELMPYVNHGRWVADCPCGGGMGAREDWPLTCFDCGTVYPPPVFPPDASEAEAVLAERPAGARHWRPLVETVDDLRGENARHDVAVP